MKWPVTRDKEGESGIIFLDFSEILKFTVQGGRRLVHTVDGVFYEPDSIDRLQSALQQSGLPFERADRGNLINITRVVEIDEKKALAIFESPEPGVKGKDSTISKPDNFKRILKKFREMIPGNSG